MFGRLVDEEIFGDVKDCFVVVFDYIVLMRSECLIELVLNILLYIYVCFNKLFMRSWK